MTQEELAQLANCSLDTIKRLLRTKECPNGVERWAVENIAKALGIEPTDIVDPKDWYGQNSLPPEFESLIAEKIKMFGYYFSYKRTDFKWTCTCTPNMLWRTAALSPPRQDF